MGLGVDGGWMPVPTRPQQYCDSASLVFRNLGYKNIKASKCPEIKNVVILLVAISTSFEGFEKNDVLIKKSVSNIFSRVHATLHPALLVGLLVTLYFFYDF